MEWPAILLAVLTFAAAGLAISRVLVRRFIRRRTHEIREAVAGQRVLRATEKACLIGQASRKSQLRGNGVLVLTPEALSFYMLAPRREYRMPLGSISGFEHPRRFKGRTAFKELLVVRLRGEGGEDDALGIQVDDPRGWAESARRAAAG